MRVLVFAPHAGIWQHAFPEALIADAVRAAGASIIYVTCDGTLASGCVTMFARGLTVASAERDRLAVCRDCRRNRDWLRRGFDLHAIDFDSALAAADYAEIERLADTARAEGLANFAVGGVPVGRAAMYEFLIQRKKIDFEVSDAEWVDLRPRLVNTLRALFAARTILDRERPDRVIAYNTLYSVNRMWRAAADLHGIPMYFLHAGIRLKNRLQTMMIGRDSSLRWSARLIDAWPAHADVPCSAGELAQVTDHFEQLFVGRSVFAYSAAKSQRDVRERFAVRADQKLLVASMSSYDEYVAAEATGEMPSSARLVFPTQIEWIRALVDWVRARPELALVIRVHPREFPNKRERTRSEHAARLERELAELPPNARVNWPSDELSIYDLAEHADVFLNAWSSAGKEMALLGIPTVVYSPELLLYPPDLGRVGTTYATYFAEIEAALRDGWSFERVRRAYRWWVLELVSAVVDIGDGFAFAEEPPKTVLERGRAAVFALPGVRQHRDLWRRPRLLAQQRRIGELFVSGKPTLLDVPAARSPITEATETAALRAQLRRLIAALYPHARDAPEPGSLRAKLVAAVL